jgi:twitching motility protein PilT
MPLVDSLLTAIVRSDGDALVLHVGEKPYVVAAAGTVELSRQGLGLGAMEGLLAQLLSADALRGLREMGAVEHELAASPAGGADRFTVVAARGGDDIWIEVRRHRRVRAAAPAATSVATAAIAEAAGHAAAPVSAVEPAPRAAHDVARPEVPPAAAAAPPSPAASSVPPGEATVVEELPVAVPAESPVADAMPPAEEVAAEVSVVDTWAAEHVPAIDFERPLAAAVPPIEFGPPPVVAAPASFEAALPAGAVPPVEPMPSAPVEAAPGPVTAPAAEATVPEFVAAVPAPEAPPAAPAVAAPTTKPGVSRLPDAAPAAASYPAPHYDAPAAAAAPRAPISRVEPTVSESPVHRASDPQPTLPGLPPSYEGEATAVTRDEASTESLPGVVLSLTRDSARTTGPSSRAHGRAGGIERLLRLAAARGASALYLTTQARPAVRVDGDIRLLEGEATLSSGDVEAAVLELAPEGARDKESAEWIRDLQDVGRVRITTFRDYRGPGALLRMISARATSAEQLGLVREIQALAMEPEGLVIVTGPRASGKSTLVSAYVDLINRQRNDYVITLEGQIRLVHESRGSLISQRELRGSAAEVVAAARAALRENPDVLIIEDLRSPDVLQIALDAAGSGLLVFASVTAASATAALERLVDLCPSEQRRTVRAALAEHLRGVVAQVLLRKAGGGRLAARELVLNTNAVAALVSDGQIAQLPRAIDSGRKLGMAPLNDALVAFVQSGAVDVREAYRKADDKVGLLGLLRREGIDTSFVERLA